MNNNSESFTNWKDIQSSMKEIADSTQAEVNQLKNELKIKTQLLRGVLGTLQAYGYNPDSIQDDIAAELGIELDEVSSEDKE